MTTSSLVFVDARISDYAQLMAYLPTTAEVVVLDSATDGLQQIADYLAGRTAIEAIHVVSHGSQGALYLGNARVDGDYLTGHSAQLASIGSGLTETGDILLYGCNVAQGDVGLQFVQSLANLTGADVAASVDVTGPATSGGDWELEYTAGNVVLPIHMSESWTGLLGDDYAATTATTGVVPVGGQVTGTIELVQDEDWFKVALVAGTTYVFDLRGADGGGGTLGTGSAEAYLKLYGPNGSYTGTTAYNGGTGGDPLMSYAATVSGNYYLSVSDLMDAGTGTYTLRVSESAVTDDYAATTATTGVVPVGGQVTGTIELVQDEDWFKVALVAGTTYVFDLRGADGDGGTLGTGSAEAYLKLYGPNGSYTGTTAYNGGTGGDPLMSYAATVSGNYYLSVSDLMDAGTGTYTLRVSESAVTDDYAATTATTGVVPVGGQVTGTIELVQDEDWFKVALVAGTTYVFDLRGADGGGGTLGTGSAEAYLKLYGPNGSYTGTTAYNGGTGGDPLMSYAATVSGNYYLSVSDLMDAGTGTYTLRVSESAVTDDYAATTATTGVVPVGGQVTGTIELVQDEDWFKVALVAGTTYVFDLRGADGDGGTLGTGSAEAYLKLYGPNGSYTGTTAYNGGTGGDPLMSYAATVSGNYYLSVSDLMDAGTGTYTLRVSESAVTDDYAATTATTGVVPVGGQVTGTIELVQDEDWFKVALVAGTTYVFDLRGADGDGGTLGTGSAEAYLKLYGPNGSYTGTTAYNGGTGGDPLMSYAATVSGNYYLSVSDLMDAGTGTYTLRVSTAYENVNTPPAGLVVVTGTAIQGQALTVTNTLADVDGLGTISYQWKANGAAITGATGTTYTLGQADVGKTISVTASYTDGQGTIEAITSATTAAITSTVNTITGNSSNNVLLSTVGNDAIDGSAGTDTVSYANATAAVTVTLTSNTEQNTGGAGIDTLLNIENLTGSKYNDKLTGNAAANVLNGGAGADTMTGGNGNDTYYVNHASDLVNEALAGGTDTVYSTLLAYTLRANVEKGVVQGTVAGNLTGNALANTLTGNATANRFTGGAGNDTLQGKGGNDILIGGAGKDVLTGGAGNDVFDFNTVAESGLTATTRDVITDFVRGQDKIDLSTIDANTALTGNQAFTGLIGANVAFTKAGQLKLVAGVLYGNTDADTAAEFSIALTGITTLANTDFVL